MLLALISAELDDDPIFSDCMRASQNVQHVPNSYEGTTVATQEMQTFTRAAESVAT